MLNTAGKIESALINTENIETKGQHKRIRHRRKLTKAVPVFITIYLFKDRSVAERTVWTWAIVHNPPKDVAAAMRAYCI